MRKVITSAMTVVLAAGMLVGCTAGPNEEAVKAASTYSDKLDKWSKELSTAAKSARTATTTEWTATKGKLKFDEVGLGEVLETAPTLKKFSKAEIANTPTYRTAARAAEQIEAITEELAGFEPEAISALRQASGDSYFVVADLYYNTLSGPATDRLTAQGEALEHTDDFPTFYKILRKSSLNFAKKRLDLLGVAVKDMGGSAKGADHPVTPKDGLGVSVSAFIVDWLNEEAAYQEDLIDEIGGWKTLGSHSDTFLNFSNVSGTFTAPAQNAEALRTAYVSQVGDIATVVSTTTAADANPKASVKLPAIGDPYRQVLLDGYLPWEEPAEKPEYTVDRLWMLWHIRELEKTPDAAYSAARVALLEELNRSLEDGAALDVRPGSGRLLSYIKANTLTFSFSSDVASNKRVVAGIEELLGYGEMLSGYPMMPKVDAGFDEVRKLYAEMVVEMKTLMTETPDKFDQWVALEDLEKKYQDKVYDAALPALEDLEDDARAQPLTAAAIEATAPGESSEKSSPTPTP